MMCQQVLPIDTLEKDNLTFSPWFNIFDKVQLLIIVYMATRSLKCWENSTKLLVTFMVCLKKGFSIMPSCLYLLYPNGWVIESDLDQSAM